MTLTSTQNIEKVAALRAVLVSAGETQKRVRLGPARLDDVLGGGLKCGALHEIFAAPSHETAASGFAAGLAGRIGGPVFWIAQEYSLLEHGGLAATGFTELGLPPDRLYLLRAPDVTGVLRAGLEAMSCPALGAVVLEVTGDSKLLDLVAYRKLTLAAAESRVTVLLLRFGSRPSLGVAETRWRIRSLPSGENTEVWGAPVLEAELQRNRAGRGGCWSIEWSCDDGLFRAANPGAVVSEAGDRSFAAPLAEISAAWCLAAADHGGEGRECDAAYRCRCQGRVAWASAGHGLGERARAGSRAEGHGRQCAGRFETARPSGRLV
ncbi:hypothetical protein FHS83_001738 [Rhizomicrobium palustre]|uniref:Protein ImuA n=1 Tax=Rhizomicrobium palustre TaxID=189966 RepID=A0A846MZN8_9PROT|nr:hypothetical protein [Rhizomicrobium palustre]